MITSLEQVARAVGRTYGSQLICVADVNDVANQIGDFPTYLRLRTEADIAIASRQLHNGASSDPVKRARCLATIAKCKALILAAGQTDSQRDPFVGIELWQHEKLFRSLQSQIQSQIQSQVCV